MGTHGLGLRPKEHTGAGIGGHGILAKQVVAVLVPNGNAGTFVIPKFVRFEQPVLYSPADIKAVTAVPDGPVAPDDRVLRTAARVQTEPGVILRQAILEDNPLGNLETNP